MTQHAPQQSLPFGEDAQHINRRQYALPGEESPEATFRRVARFIARGNPERADIYAQLMIGRRFCPGGRVLAGADTSHNNVLNCFVQEATEHQPGTYEAVEELQLKLALVTKVGGGNGVNLDPYPARQPATPTSHTLHAYLSAEHPDVRAFIMGVTHDVRGEELTLPPRTWTNVRRTVVYDREPPSDLITLCQEHGVHLEDQMLMGMEHRHVISVPDDLKGIIQAAQQAARALAGGTVAVDFTPMRPEGAPIRGSGGTSSGPVSFLHEIFINMLTWVNLGGLAGGPINVLRYVYAPALRVVRQGGTRRGAGMATISVTHPDVLDFLTAKDLDREAAEGDISTFNLSFLVTDDFMQLVDTGGWITCRAALGVGSVGGVPGKYDLSAMTEAGAARVNPDWIPGSYQINARWLYQEVAQHAWSTGEPGVIFIDRVNEYSALKNLGERYRIRSTNPCLAPGTLVYYREVGSDDGPHAAPVESLLSRDVEVIDGVTGQWHRTRFRVTGRSEVVWNLETDHGGTEYATPYHKFFLADGTAVQLRELEVGDQLQAGNGNLFTVQDVGSDARTEAEVYCCTVQPHHRFTLASGLQSGNCGEIPLTVGEPCDLGAINLGQYVTGGTFDEAAFRADVQTCVEFLDDVLDVNVFALEDNREASRSLRRVGLGVMGLADMLVKLKLPYSSQEGREAVRRILGIMRDEAIRTSERLGRERGVYPVYAEHNTFTQDGEYSGPIPHAPRRNVALLTVAPTGTTSMLMDASSGIEPIYSPFVYRRIGSEQRKLVNALLMETLTLYPAPERLRSPDGRWDAQKTVAALEESTGSLRHAATADFPEEIKRIFEFAHDVTPEDHIRMQGVIQRTFDAEGFAGNSLSKTINLPNHAAVSDVLSAYQLAHTEGCKGVTVYRDGSRQFQPLNTSAQNEAASPDPLAGHTTEELVRLARDLQERNAQLQHELDSLNVAAPAPVTYSATRFTRTPVLHGQTVQVKLSSRETNRMTSYLVVINHDHSTRLPIEVILVGGSSGEEAHADSEALGKLASKTLQAGVNPRTVIRALKDTEGGLNGYAQFGNAPDARRVLITSKAQLIAHALEAALAHTSEPSPQETSGPAAATWNKDCGVCQGRATVVFTEGCEKCQACGASKCG